MRETVHHQSFCLNLYHSAPLLLVFAVGLFSPTTPLHHALCTCHSDKGLLQAIWSGQQAGSGVDSIGKEEWREARLPGMRYPGIQHCFHATALSKTPERILEEAEGLRDHAAE